MKIFAETERLILREIELLDCECILQLDSDPDVLKYLDNIPISTVDEANNTIKFIRAQYIENQIGRWAIIDKKSNQFIGWSGLKLIKDDINNHTHFYELGYRILKKYWGLGYATEAALASIVYGFKHLSLNEIYAIADSRNIDSHKVLKKVGMHLINTFDYNGVKHIWYKINNVENR